MTAAFALATAAPANAEIVADSGFRPNPDGFSFENYTTGRLGLNAVEMQRIFGREVCLTGKGTKCVLRPVVRTEMRSVNKSMEVGHCYGFAVLSTTIYKGLLPRFGYTSLAQLGAPGPGATTFDIPLEGNRVIQRSLARAWTFQMLPRVRRAVVGGKPSDVLNKLLEEMRPDASEGWTLGLHDGGAAGHAVTPYAVDDLGGGKYEILVYDNNWPNTTRRIQVDTVAETWEYEIFEDVFWTGDAESKSMTLHPLRPGLGVHPCGFCTGRAGWRSKFTDVTLDGAGVEHAHLILRDKRGRRTGIVGGELVREIPGVRVVRRTGGARLGADGEPSLVSVEPIYRVPKGRRVEIVVDGRHLKLREHQTLTVVGPTFDATVQRLVIDPGERARLVLNPRRQRLVYAPAPATKDAAVRFGAERRAGKKLKRLRAAYDVEIAALGLPDSVRVGFHKRPRYGLLQFGYSAKQRVRVRYRVRIREHSRKGKVMRTRYFTLTGRERSALLRYGSLGAKLGNPKVVVFDERGKHLRGKRKSELGR